MMPRTYPIVLIQADRAGQPEWMWWLMAAIISVIVGIAASFHLVPAAAALAPQVGALGAHVILVAIYGLATLVMLSVLRLTAAR